VGRSEKDDRPQLSGSGRLRKCNRQKRENEEKHAQTDGDEEQDSFHAAAGSENTAGIVPGQTAKPNAFILQNDAGDKCNRSYNQSDIEITIHVLPPRLLTARLYLSLPEFVNQPCLN
jgi:hypothetical protein